MGEYGEYLRKELRKANAIANKIIMTRNYPGKATLAFLIVEGMTDKNLYQTYINTIVCQIIVADGKDNVREVLAILERESCRGVLAIVDADFDVLEGKTPQSPNIFMTDTHDLEMMLIQSPALEKVLAEFGSEDKIARFVTTHGKDVRSFLLESVQSIGYLRWLSARENLSLKFEGMGFEKFVEKDTLKINILKLIRLVQGRSVAPTAQKRSLDTDIHEKVKLLSNDSHDLWHVCCGHDITCILSFGLQKAIGSKRMEPDMVEICLRLAYEYTYFRQTKLYISVKQWEMANSPFVVLV
jgi:Protein of unknown function (DUF4435)